MEVSKWGHIHVYIFRGQNFLDQVYTCVIQIMNVYECYGKDERKIPSFTE